MTPFAQNIAVLLIISACVGYVGWQMVQAFRGRKSKLGSCCAKGCSTVEKTAIAESQRVTPVQFLPLASVGRPSRK